ncbi:hypothetical protein CW734_10370 [Planococcus sp. MB-3u-03]|nr:hypothetical protein CW734_10370 [Planococcus sp. MB-3u-03]
MEMDLQNETLFGISRFITEIKSDVLIFSRLNISKRIFNQVDVGSSFEVDRQVENVTIRNE